MPATISPKVIPVKITGSLILIPNRLTLVITLPETAVAVISTCIGAGDSALAIVNV